MRYYRCKCGSSEALGSTPPYACTKCDKCGSDLATHPDSHGQPKPHDFSGEDGRCQYCHRRRDQIVASSEKCSWEPIETAPKDGTSILAYDGNGNGPIHIRWHEPWNQWVLADVLLRLNIQEPSDAPVRWHHVPELDE